MDELEFELTPNRMERFQKSGFFHILMWDRLRSNNWLSGALKIDPLSSSYIFNTRSWCFLLSFIYLRWLTQTKKWLNLIPLCAIFAQKAHKGVR